MKDTDEIATLLRQILKRLENLQAAQTATVAAVIALAEKRSATEEEVAVKAMEAVCTVAAFDRTRR